MWGDDKFGHMLKMVRNSLFVLTDVYVNVTCVTCYVCNVKTFGEITVSFCFVTLRMLYVKYVTVYYILKNELFEFR
jgi:hypothetical protein